MEEATQETVKLRLNPLEWSTDEIITLLDQGITGHTAMRVAAQEWLDSFLGDEARQDEIVSCVKVLAQDKARVAKQVQRDTVTIRDMQALLTDTKEELATTQQERGVEQLAHAAFIERVIHEVWNHSDAGCESGRREFLVDALGIDEEIVDAATMPDLPDYVTVHVTFCPNWDNLEADDRMDRHSWAHALASQVQATLDRSDEVQGSSAYCHTVEESSSRQYTADEMS